MSLFRKFRDRLIEAASTTALTVGTLVTGAAIVEPEARAEVARDDVGHVAIRDTGNAWPWVGQMITWNNPAVLSFGLCTGQPISPRVVLFAAHCIGGVANSEVYGGASPNMSFMFNPNNLAALRQYVGLDPSTTPIGLSNEANRVYRVIDVIAHPLNANNPFAAGSADIAIAVLDQPINGFDGYGMLFTPLTALERVELVGYGNYGTMSSGQVSIDWWRRAGENYLGFLGSDNDVFASDLFGNNPPSAGWDGDLYWLDNDSHLDPRPAGDFNIFGGAALPNEVGIAQGDSGGAMWIRRNGVPIAIGVASYGYSTGPAFGHGTFTAHTPLFPYWDFIVANNPYVYAAGKTGGGSWESGATWVQMLDPNYLIFAAGGAVVNGLPTTDPVSDQGGSPNVGGVRPLPVTPVPNSGAQIADLNGGASLNAQRGDLSLQVTLDGGPVSAQSEVATLQRAPLDAAGAATLSGIGAVRGNPVSAVGGTGSGFWPVGGAPMTGPGSTNFVPDNTNGAIGTPFVSPARFFEVQLVNSGIVTLSSARTIDRLRIMAAPAGLTINSGALLTTVMSSSVEAGALTVNGTLRARGIGLLGGQLNGTGLLQATGGVGVLGAVQSAGTLAVTGGVLAPGAVGTVGTMSLQGNASFASGVFAIDVASLATHDRFYVSGLAGTSAGANGTFTSPGAGALPTMQVNWLGAFSPVWGDAFTIVTATGGVTGDFAVTDNLAGVLFANYNAVGNTGVITIEAAPFVGAAAYVSYEQREVARGLDAIRAAPGGYAALSNLFASVDNTALAALPEAFEAMTPLNAFSAAGLTEATSAQIAEGLSQRNDHLLSGGGRGFQTTGVEQLGLSAQLASADPYDAMMMGAAAVAAAEEAAAGSNGGVTPMREGWGGFINISTLLDTSYAMTAFVSADVEAVNGTIGLDRTFSAGAGFLGAALSYNSGEATSSLPAQTAEADSFGLNIYGGDRWGRWRMDGQVGLSRQSYNLERIVPLLGGTQTLSASPDGDTISAAAEVGYDFASGNGVVTPFLGLDGIWVSIDGYVETGGSAAMTVEKRSSEILDARMGVAYRNAFRAGAGELRPLLSVAYAADLANDDNLVAAAFDGFPSVPMSFAGSSRDDGWVEYEMGIEYEGPRMGVSLSYSGANNGQLDYGALAVRGAIVW